MHYFSGAQIYQISLRDEGRTGGGGVLVNHQSNRTPIKTVISVISTANIDRDETVIDPNYKNFSN